MQPQCFKYIVHDPPRPLTEEDIWFQIGHVHEQQKDVSANSSCAMLLAFLNTTWGERERERERLTA